MTILGIDPGKHTGLAWVRDGVAVHTAMITRKKNESAWNFCDRIRLEAGHDYCLFRVVIERPMVYPKSPIRASDIVNLAFLAGALAGVFSQHWEVATPTSYEWKGQVDKKIHNLRIIRAVRGLSESMPDHIIDAAGLAYYGETGTRL
jgi:hypothetical protein